MRVKLLIVIGIWSAVILGGAWSIYHLCHHKWLLMACNLSELTVGLFALKLVRAGQDRPAAIWMAHGLLVMISLTCLLDMPVAGAVRSVHMYFLPLAAGTTLVFRNDKPYLRVALPFIMLAGCLIFASTHVGVSKPDLLADYEFRAMTAWINNFAALSILGIALIVMQTDITIRNSLYIDMREALAKGHFCLHYQPQVDSHGHIFGAEALLRWEHPQKGMIPPGSFISLAEETGLILPIGSWVLKEACAHLAKWSKDAELAHLTISVNVSASQLRQPDFVQEVTEIITRSGANPSRLKLELTESMFAKDVEATIKKMNELCAIGISWSLDDFGTGYSSLNYLKHLPFTQLKIDQSFVRDLLVNESDKAIVETLVVLSKNLNMMLIAEGVETTEQLQYLINKGCLKFQGYFFSKPLPIDTFEMYHSTFHASVGNKRLRELIDKPSASTTLQI